MSGVCVWSDPSGVSSQTFSGREGSLRLWTFTGGEWPIPIWCRMFQKTLDGSARGWFKRLPPGSINEWSEPREAFTIRWTTETGFILGVLEVMKISSFIDSLKCPELAKRYYDKVAKTVEEMMVRLDDFVRSEEAFARTELPSSPISLLEDMDSESAHMVAASKVPMLKLENGNSAPKTTVVEGVEKVIPPTTVEEKAQKRLEVKARSTLMMGIPNEHQLKFNSIMDVSHCWKILKRDLEHQVSDMLTPQNVDKLSDARDCALFSSQPNNPQLANEDLQQFYPDDLEEIDLRWQMAMLTMRARRFLKNTRRKVTINGNETIGFDKSKVECYNCHKKGHFARKCKTPRNQENKNREGTRRSVLVETTTSNALISCDGLGDYDWSDQAEECPTNFALMTYSSISSNSKVSTDSNCSSSCLENVKILKEQNEQLLKDLRTSKLNTIAYKTGLESVEARLLVYKKNESVYEEDIKLLKCLGYNVVPPPYTGNFMPPKHDLSGLEEFVNEPIVNEPTVKKSVVETSKAKASADKPKCGFCSRHMTWNMSYLTNFEEIDRGYIAFGGNPKGGKITSRGVIIRYEFKNKEMNQFCERKGIKREFSIARTPQQNRVAERKNRTLIEAARTMLADSKLPTTFWAEVVNTACYVQNRGDIEKKVMKKYQEMKVDVLIQVIDSREEDDISTVNTAGIEVNVVSSNTSIELPNDQNMLELEDIIEEEVYVYQPSGFEDPDLPDRVYKVEMQFMENFLPFRLPSAMLQITSKAFDVKTVNGEQQLQALVDRKKIIINEATIKKEVLHLEDADGKGKCSDMPTDPHHTPTIIPPSTSQPQRKQRPRKPKRKDTEIPQSSVLMDNVADEVVYEERDDSLEKGTTTVMA
ncbi:ribonuclease H-like domain-containing protein [Tanacetum coccineum]